MDIREILKIGDEVVVSEKLDNRSEIAVVIGFAEKYYGRTSKHPSGVYVNRNWVRLRLRGGRECVRWIAHIELADRREYEKRIFDFVFKSSSTEENIRKDFIRPLPKTSFWEGDEIYLFKEALDPLALASLYEHKEEASIVVGINYREIEKKTAPYLKYFPYKVSDSLYSDWSVSVGENALGLVKRGNIWKLYHQESLFFHNSQEKRRFFLMVRANSGGNQARQKL